MMDKDGATAAGTSRPKISFGGLRKSNAPASFEHNVRGQGHRNALSFQEDEDGGGEVADGGGRGKQKTGVIDGRSFRGVAGAAPSSRSSRQRQEDALAVDPSVFDYDAVFDSMKAGAERVKAQRKEEEQKRDPKYMQASLAASEQRKLDRTRAEARKIQRQRQDEGDAFADTESFVTGAYKRQMEEMRKDEESEREREKAERKSSKGVAGFYKDFLAEQDRTHNAAVEAAAAAAAATAALTEQGGAHGEPKEEQSEEQRKRRRIEEAKQRGFDVRTNDDNEVVDERSLLSAGLNTFGSKKHKENAVRRRPEEEEEQGHRRGDVQDATSANKRERSARDAQRARQSKMIEEQMVAIERQKEEERMAQERAQKEALTTVHRRNDANRIEQARQRAIERRKQRDEQKSNAGNMDKSS